MSAYDSTFRRIAGQSTKPRHSIKGSRSGTDVTPLFGKTQGMKPNDFKAFKRIVNQKQHDPYAARSIGGVPTKERVPRVPKADSETDTTSEKFIEKAKKRFQIAADAEADIRKESLADLKFLAGDQWDDKIKQQRQMDGRPCLTINRLPQFVRQVTNEQRQNRPGIQVNPVGDESDPETAEILQGLIRHIEYDSGADAAYDTAFFNAASCGFGYYRLTTEYSGPYSFEQDIKIKRVRNPFTVYLDPNAKEPDFSDAEWGFVIDTMSKDAYKAAYPDSKLSTMDNWQSIGDTGEDWVSQDACRVAEYFWRETEEETICQLSDGSVVLKDILPDELPKSIRVVSERKTDITKVKWAKLNGIETLEDTEWAGRWIPIIKVVGDEFDIDGKVVLKGVVRDAKEPQMQSNFMKSAATESIALAPKAPYIGVEGQFEGFEKQWQMANIKNFAYLEHKAVSVNGTLAPPPQRNVAEPAIMAIVHAMSESADDMKAVTGIYDASLGAQGNETSGKAILARQQQTQGGNFHYIDNLTRALRHTGRVLLDLIPKIYDTPRVIRIIGEDGEQSTVTVNQQPDPKEQHEEEAVQKIYDLTVGKYDVTISTGPSYESRRQEAVDSMIELYKADPQLMATTADIWVGLQDWPGARKMAERIKKTLPPNLQEDEDDEPSQLPPQVQQQVQRMHDQIQQLTQALQQAQQEVQTHMSVKKLETDSRERIAAGQQRLDEMKIRLEAAKIQASVMTAQAQIDAERTDAEAQRTYDFLAQITGEHHEAAMQQMGHEQGLDQGEQQQEFAQQNQQAEQTNQQ